MDGSSLIVGLVVGSVGFGLFWYGRKQRRAPQMIVGLIMLLYPYFVSSVPATAALAVGLVGLLWFLVSRGM